jgi:hypothetical protein
MSPREAFTFAYTNFRQLSLLQQLSLIVYAGLLYELFIK